MNDEIAGIFEGYLSIDEETNRHVLEDMLELCKSEKGADEAIVRLGSMVESYSSGLEFLDQVPLYFVFLAYAQYKWGNLSDLEKSASNAIEGFKQQNKVRDNAIVLWMRALIHKESGHIDAAVQDIANGIELIEREFAHSKRTSHYQECKDCELIHSRMIEFRKGLDPIFQKRAPKPGSPNPLSPPKRIKARASTVGRGSYLSFPRYTVCGGMTR